MRITLQGHEGELRMPDILFRMPDGKWLTSDSLPEQPVPIWGSSELGLTINLIDQKLPTIYGDLEFPGRNCQLPSNKQPATINKQQVCLPIDIFGSAFFMLTRYEELVKQERDAHDRFPAHASLAFQQGFLDRPIIDEYVEVLWAVMKRLWPGLERKKREPRTFISCDVDEPYGWYLKRLRNSFLKIGADVIIRRSPRMAAVSLVNSVAARMGVNRFDPNDTFEWIMDVNERAGNRVAFYFIAEHTRERDCLYNLEEPCIRNLMKRIHERGHEIGLHGSYVSYKDEMQTVREAELLRQVMECEGINMERMGGRMHCLRWDARHTPLAWEAAGMDYDSTLSFADRPGFRCGTSHDYPFFSIPERRTLKLQIRPLVVMECSVISNKYMSLGYSCRALELMQELKERCHMFNGNFSLLWHNNHFDTPKDKLFYERLI